MKKRIVGFVLVLTMIMTSVMPAFAADEAVQTAYDAYVAMKTAMENKDLAALKTATAALEAASENLTEEQTEELWNMDEEFLDNLLTAAMVQGMAELYDAFLADKNAATAMIFVESYTLLTDDEEMKALIIAMIPDIVTVYTDAINYLPSADVITIYEAYGELQIALMMGWVEDLEASVETLSVAIDDLDNLSDKDLAALAALLEEDATIVVEMIKTDYSNANVVLEVAQVYNAFLENSSKKTAEAFVAKYDSIYDAEDEALKEAVSNFFFDIDDVYDEASALLEEDGGKATTSAPKTDKADETDKVEKSPQTGDGNVLMIWVMLMMIAGAGIVIAGKKRVTYK